MFPRLPIDEALELLTEQARLWRGEADDHRERNDGYQLYAEALDDCALELEQIIGSINKGEINRSTSDSLFEPQHGGNDEGS